MLVKPHENNETIKSQKMQEHKHREGEHADKLASEPLQELAVEREKLQNDRMEFERQKENIQRAFRNKTDSESQRLNAQKVQIEEQREKLKAEQIESQRHSERENLKSEPIRLETKRKEVDRKNVPIHKIRKLLKDTRLEFEIQRAAMSRNESEVQQTMTAVRERLQGEVQRLEQSQIPETDSIHSLHSKTFDGNVDDMVSNVKQHQSDLDETRKLLCSEREKLEEYRLAIELDEVKRLKECQEFKPALASHECRHVSCDECLVQNKQESSWKTSKKMLKEEHEEMSPDPNRSSDGSELAAQSTLDMGFVSLRLKTGARKLEKLQMNLDRIHTDDSSESVVMRKHCEEHVYKLKNFHIGLRDRYFRQTQDQFAETDTPQHQLQHGPFDPDCNMVHQNWKAKDQELRDQIKAISEEHTGNRVLPQFMMSSRMGPGRSDPNNVRIMYLQGDIQSQ